MEENLDIVEIFFHNLPVLSPETLLPAGKVQVLILWLIYRMIDRTYRMN